MKRPRWLALLLHPVTILVLAALVRLAFILSMGNRYYFGDTKDYLQAATRMLAGLPPAEGDPRAPLYPAIMALGFLIGGPGDVATVRILQLFLSVALVALTMRLGWRLGGARVMLPAGVLMAFGPLYVFTAGLLYPTTLYTLLLMCMAMMAYELDEKPRPLPAVVLGITIGLGWMTDQVIIAPVFAILAWLAWPTRTGWRARLGMTAVAVVTAAMIVVPYVQSHRRMFGQNAAFMSKAQYVLHWARTDSSVAKSRWVRYPADSLFAPLPARQFLSHEGNLILHQPVAYAHDVAVECLHFFKPIPDRVQSKNQYNQPSVLWVAAVHFAPVMLFGIWGAWRADVSRRRRWLLLAPVLATTAFYSLFFTQTRYRIPIEPYLVLLAALGFVKLFPRLAAALSGDDAPGAGRGR